MLCVDLVFCGKFDNVLCHRVRNRTRYFEKFIKYFVECVVFFNPLKYVDFLRAYWYDEVCFFFKGTMVYIKS